MSYYKIKEKNLKKLLPNKFNSLKCYLRAFYANLKLIIRPTELIEYILYSIIIKLEIN